MNDGAPWGIMPIFLGALTAVCYWKGVVIVGNVSSGQKITRADNPVLFWFYLTLMTAGTVLLAAMAMR